MGRRGALSAGEGLLPGERCRREGARNLPPYRLRTHPSHARCLPVDAASSASSTLVTPQTLMKGCWEHCTLLERRGLRTCSAGASAWAWS